MSQIEITEKPLPAVRLAARRGEVSEQREVSGFVGPAFDQVADVLMAHGASLATPIAEYDMSDDGVRIVVGFEYGGPELDGVEIVELPAAPDAVCGIHLGAMDRIAESWQALSAEVVARGCMPSGPGRELYLRSASDDQSDWVTELQQPVRRA